MPAFNLTLKIAPAIAAVAIAALMISNSVQAATQENNHRFAVYNGFVQDPSGVPSPQAGTVLIDTATGRSWELVRTKPGIRWAPIHFLPTLMAGDGKTLMGGTVTPEP
jgi:hypothetical protein